MSQLITKLTQSFANFAWSNNPNPSITPQSCLSTISPSLDLTLFSACFTSLLAKLLGIAIICGACLNKAPLFRNIFQNKTVAGLSTNSVYSETIMYANAAFYCLLKRNPFSSWGENGLLTLQCLVICILVWIYTDDPHKISYIHRMVAIVFFSLYLVVVFVILPPESYYLLMTVNWPVLIYSRGSQIYTFWKCQHTGALSVITTLMNLTGSFIRLFTTVKEVGMDWTILSGYLMSLSLNAIMVMQFWLYKDNTAKYLQSISKKKE